MKPILRKISKAWLSKKVPSFYRNLYKQIDFNTRIIGIKGARGSGKTTIIHQYAKNSNFKPSQILYVSCDSPIMADVDLFELATSFEQYGGKLLLIDEIHKSDNFSAHIKSMYDFLNIQVIFTGSSAIILNHESSDLSRRATMHYLPPMSLREFISLKENINLKSYTLKDISQNHEDISFEILEQIKPLEQYSNYIKYGAYPFFKESITDYPLRLLEVINITIESDLSTIFNIDASKQNVLKRVLSMLCSTSPYEISKSKLSQDTNISWATLSKYLTYMQKGDLINLIDAPNNHKKLNKASKMLLNNPNLFHILCSEPNIGSIRESYFVSQLNHIHNIHYHDMGDFIIDDGEPLGYKYIFEIGGASKGDKQIKNINNGFVVRDDIETGYDNIIPLWLFGFLY
ncbi:MAG: AAA family ATPase [uncultured Campylobacterales bacterium]|uniref:AAA family ATPase n=1 Tax=uncultured Campylobacterales bacterium TaxID=352960 RepID=A0A6S6SJM0_9BACT|nr:MAG: AAA family ATPase [uncultured Campylobacterales bacterium]